VARGALTALARTDSELSDSVSSFGFERDTFSGLTTPGSIPVTLPLIPKFSWVPWTSPVPDRTVSVITTLAVRRFPLAPTVNV
jgi:hypothetical protein